MHSLRTSLVLLAIALPLRAQGDDSCTSAQPISGTGAFPFDTSAATTDGLADMSCAIAGSGQIERDVWWLWTPLESDPYRVSTCGATSLDTRIAVYDGPCGAPLMACDDDGCADGTGASSLVVDVVVGHVYVIRLGVTPGTAGGTGTLVVENVGPPPVPDGDFCNGDGGDQTGCTDCPCGNEATPGTVGGCENSAGRGARLVRSGTASVSADSLRFELVGATPSSLATLISGDATAPANPASACFGLGSGVPSMHLDGLRCVVSGVRRHATLATDASGDVGATNAGWGTTGGLVAEATAVAGAVLHFQVIYRESPGALCLTGQNSSQGVTVSIVP